MNCLRYVRKVNIFRCHAAQQQIKSTNNIIILNRTLNTSRNVDTRIYQNIKPFYLSYQLEKVNPIHVAWYSTKTEEPNLFIDHSAIEQLKKVLKEEEFLRVFVEGGGCSGFQYKFEIDNNLDKDEDIVFDNNDTKVVTDEESLNILSGSTVEYHVDMMRAGFRIVNIPQADKGCSCGVSFSVKL